MTTNTAVVDGDKEGLENEPATLFDRPGFEHIILHIFCPPITCTT